MDYFADTSSVIPLDRCTYGLFLTLTLEPNFTAAIGLRATGSLIKKGFPPVQCPFPNNLFVSTGRNRRRLQVGREDL